jgi:hypothetical protein
MTQAQERAAAIMHDAEIYVDTVKKQVPDLELWESELRRIREEEESRLVQLVEPTIINYLKSIDAAMTEIVLSLPIKYQQHKVIQKFVAAIRTIQSRKSQIDFSKIKPKAS